MDLAHREGFVPVLLAYKDEIIAPKTEEMLARSNSPPIIRVTPTSSLPPAEVGSTLSAFDEWFVLGLDDYVCEYAAEISTFARKRLMLPSAARTTLQKHKLRQRWNRLCTGDRHLHPVPFRFLKYEDTLFRSLILTIDSEGFSENHACVVKPDALDASIGINRLNGLAGLSEVVEKLRDELHPLASIVEPLGISIHPNLIVEHLIRRNKQLHAGAEFSAEFITINAVHSLMGITQKYIDESSFVEVGHCFPAETFPPDLQASLTKATCTLLDDIGVYNAISHWEYIVTADFRLALVEAQIRPAGDFIMDLVSRSTGRNPYSVLFQGYRNNHGPDTFKAGQTAAVFFPMPTRAIAGDISLQVSSEAKDITGVEIISMDLSEQRKWSSSVQWHSRHLAIIALAEDFLSAKQKCELVLKHVNLRTFPDGDGSSLALRV